MKPHKHADLIKAWADGAEAEFFNTFAGRWVETETPSWDINTKYRIKDPYRELKEAAADPEKQIRVANIANFPWRDAGTPWDWCLPVDQYEIRDKPKAKVKVWQWVMQHPKNGVYLTTSFYSEEPRDPVSKPLYPAPWTEIEVEG